MSRDVPLNQTSRNKLNRISFPRSAFTDPQRLCSNLLDSPSPSIMTCPAAMMSRNAANSVKDLCQLRVNYVHINIYIYIYIYMSGLRCRVLNVLSGD